MAAEADGKKLAQVAVVPENAGCTAFANGGIVSGPTMGLVGEYPGARQNPEVIAPLNKLQGMIGKSRERRKHKRNWRG